MSLPFDQLSNLDQACACIGVGKSPAAGLSLEKIAFGDPASGFVRMTAFAPSIKSPPGEAADFAERLGTDDMPMIVCPATQYGVEFVDELLGRSSFMAFAKGSDFGFDRLESGVARRNLQFAWFAVLPYAFPNGLP